MCSFIKLHLLSARVVASTVPRSAAAAWGRRGSGCSGQVESALQDEDFAVCAWVGVHVCALRSGVTHTFCVRFCGTPSIQVFPLLFSESVHGGEHCHWSTCHRCFLPCRHLGSFILFFRHGKLLASAAGPLSSAAGPLSSAAGPLSSAQWPPSVADVVCPAAFLGVSVTVLARRDVRSTTLRGEGLRAVGGQPAGPSIIHRRQTVLIFSDRIFRFSMIDTECFHLVIV